MVNVPEQFLPASAVAGASLRATEARALEKILVGRPDDVEARTQLLGYYAAPSGISEELAQKRRVHVLWLIENDPEAPVLNSPFAKLPVAAAEDHARAKALWELKLKTQSQNPRVLGHAGRFFGVADPTRGNELLRRARALEPQNGAWARWGGDAEESGLFGGLPEVPVAEGLLRELAQFGSHDKARFYTLTELVKVLLKEARVDEANKYALQLLEESTRQPKDWNYGVARQLAHTVLGESALERGDLAGAKKHLHESVRDVVVSPQLKGKGPSMKLAQALLARGESDTVCEYLEACHGFWDLGHGLLDIWTEDIRAGRAPHLTNLDY